MYVNNMPFSETLHQAQKDLYDINTLLVDPMKKMQKTAKRKKIVWRLVSITEHSVGITFGVLSVIETYHQRYFLGAMYIPFMAIGAITGFDSETVSKNYAEHEKQLCDMIKTTQDTVNFSLPEQLHEIAEIVCNRNFKQK